MNAIQSIPHWVHEGQPLAKVLPQNPLCPNAEGSNVRFSVGVHHHSFSYLLFKLALQVIFVLYQLHSRTVLVMHIS